MTGLLVTVEGLEGKRLELLKEAFPTLARVAVLLDSDELRLPLVEQFLDAPAHRLGIQLRIIDVRKADDFDGAFRSISEWRAQAVMTVDTTFIVENRARIVEFSARAKLPVTAEFGSFGADGLLMAYGADVGDLMRRAATHVDRILKGAHPGDLPIEQPVKFELILNQRVARGLGISFPPPLLLRADRVLE